MNQKLREFIWRRVDYTPSTEQLAAHLHPARIKLVAGGERSGKSKSAAMELLCHVIAQPGVFWICGPDYEQSRAEFFYVLEALRKIGAVRDVNTPRIGSCRLETAFGGTVVTKTADDVRKLAGVAPDGVLLVEAAQTSWEVWLKLRGRVAEKRGWLWASGTLESGAEWYPKLWARWQADNPEGGRSFSLPTWSNLAIFPGGRQDPEILALEATLPPDLFLERYGAVPCPPSGLVFKEFSYQDHVREIVWRLNAQAAPGGWRDEAVALCPRKTPVEIAVDPGYAGGYAVLALAWLNDQVFVFDEIFAQGLVAEDIIKRCEERWWWKNVKGGVIDVAGIQHPGSKSQQEIWSSAAGLYLRTNRVGVVEGILRLRTFLINPATGKPRLIISPRCKNILEEFGKYRYPKDAETRSVTELPIDRDNHSLKALSYWLFDRFGPVARVHRRPRPGRNPFAPPREAGRTIGILPGKTVQGVRFGFQRVRPEPVNLTFEVEK